jgi:putative membrane protein
MPSGRRRWKSAAPRRIFGTKMSAVRHSGGNVQLPIIALNFLYAILGVVLMYVTYRVIDILTPQVNFHDELKKGNVAVAIFLGAIFIAIGMIVGRALN